MAALLDVQATVYLHYMLIGQPCTFDVVAFVREGGRAVGVTNIFASKLWTRSASNMPIGPDSLASVMHVVQSLA